MFSLFGGSKTGAKTYSYHMVIHVDGEPRNKVRDVHGEFSDDEGTIEEIKESIADGCRRQLGADIFVVSFRYR